MDTNEMQNNSWNKSVLEETDNIRIEIVRKKSFVGRI
jgi:hypothetical protein